jgi:hypothetical protein
MRAAILGLAGLIAGALAALGYSHYLGEGQQLSDLQGQIAKLQSDLASAKNTSVLAKRENDALADQVQQLIASKSKLEKQASDGTNAPGVTIPLPQGFNSSDMAGIMKQQLAQMNDQKLRMLEARLHLTPDQVAKLKAAMDAESDRAQAMGAKMLSGQKVDMQSIMKDAGKTKSVEQTLQDILTPDQKTAYQGIQNEQKKTQAETSASFEMNQAAPLLNLSENQKDQMESALYQVQIDSEDPKWLQQHNSSTPGDPTAYMDAQEKAKEDALSSILTPEQMAAYKQQQESQLAMQRAMLKRFMPTAPAPAPSSSPTPTP